MITPITLGNFRSPNSDETSAAYFKAAIFKLVKARREFDEDKLNRFVSIIIGRASTFDDYVSAYFYMNDQLKVDGPLHFQADDLLKKAEA